MRWVLAANGETFFSYHFTLCRFDTISMGALCAMASRAPEFRQRAVKAARITLLVLGPALLLASAIGPLGPLDPVVQVVGFPAISLFFAALVLTAATAQPDSGLYQLLSGPILARFGRYGFSMYLFHFPIFGAVSSYIPTLNGGATWHHTLLAFALTVGVGASTWRWIERPCLGLGVRSTVSR